MWQMFAVSGSDVAFQRYSGPKNGDHLLCACVQKSNCATWNVYPTSNSHVAPATTCLFHSRCPQRSIISSPVFTFRTSLHMYLPPPTLPCRGVRFKLRNPWHGFGMDLRVSLVYGLLGGTENGSAGLGLEWDTELLQISIRVFNVLLETPLTSRTSNYFIYHSKYDYRK